MNRSAANAILKNLEEPPARTLFLLITRSRGALLPTILSRSRTLQLEPLSVQDTEAVVAKVAPQIGSADDRGLAAALAAGSPRRLIELRQNDGAAIYNLMLAAIAAEDPQARLKLSGLAGEPQMFAEILELYLDYVSRRVRRLAEPGGQKVPSAPLVTWAELWDKAAVSGGEVEEYNLDRRQFVLDLLETSAAALTRSGTANQR